MGIIKNGIKNNLDNNQHLEQVRFRSEFSTLDRAQINGTINKKKVNE